VHVQPEAPRHDQQSRDRHAPAGGLEVQIVGPQLRDGARGGGVEPTRGLVVVVVAQVRADHDQGLRSAPEPLEHLGYLVGRGLTHAEGSESELAQHPLQKRKLHLQAVLLRVRGVELGYLGQVEHALDGVAIHAHRAERRQEAVRSRHRQAPDVDAMRRPEQHHALHLVAPPCHPREGGSRHGSRVDVAGVGHDHRLGNGVRIGRLGAGQLSTHFGVE